MGNFAAVLLTCDCFICSIS